MIDKRGALWGERGLGFKETVDGKRESVLEEIVLFGGRQHG
jgi:hypothetical protein